MLDKVLVQGWTHGELVIDWLYSLKLSRSFTSMNEVKGKYLECLVLKAKLDQDWETLQLQMLQTSHPKLSSSPEGNGGVGGVCRSKEPDKKKGKGEEEETDRGTGTTLVSTGAGQTCKDKDKNTKKDSCFRKLTRRACERLEMKKREWHDSSRKADTELQHWQTVVTGAEAVCNIRCRGGRTGTGFLIGMFM